MRSIGVLVGDRSRGSNLTALAAAAGSVFPAEISVVAAHRADSPAISRAREAGLNIAISSAEGLLDAFAHCDLVCLAGYLRMLPEAFARARSGTILNIHPSLLPKFGGKGMYGMHVHRAVIAARETETGCSVHWVTERYDEGDVVLQRRCPVQVEDTPETLAARVLALEHVAYPEAVRQVLHGL